MTELEALVALNMAGDIGSVRLKKLLDFFGKPQNIFSASHEKLTQVSDITEKIAEQIRDLKEEEVSREITQAERSGLAIITQDHEDYPNNLRNIFDPPIVLYVKGKLKESDRLAIAVVGSRRASFYGLSQAEKFACGLSAQGFTIISGLARGVDTAAHRGALKTPGARTISVIGSGFNHIYPPENRKLAEEVSNTGAVISEFPLDYPPLPRNFPRRNRIISGLSLGVLVVEAARNSGALITADFALEQGREVFALPGEVGMNTSWGTNGLIKQGAKLVTSIEDILEEFNLYAPAPRLPESMLKGFAEENLSPEESLVYDFISREPVLLDELIEKTDFGIAQASDIILKLQMKKLIKELPGKQFVRNDP
ncbi:MAG: DNA-processing protein DprA [Candidatus Omnitrophica bacterium]|nr:DNA-processing protein DprA [Candidatus Omnitrophota bacterium]